MFPLNFTRPRAKDNKTLIDNIFLSLWTSSELHHIYTALWQSICLFIYFSTYISIWRFLFHYMYWVNDKIKYGQFMENFHFQFPWRFCCLFIYLVGWWFGHGNGVEVMTSCVSDLFYWVKKKTGMINRLALSR